MSSDDQKLRDIIRRDDPLDFRTLFYKDYHPNWERRLTKKGWDIAIEEQAMRTCEYLHRNYDIITKVYGNRNLKAIRRMIDVIHERGTVFLFNEIKRAFYLKHIDSLQVKRYLHTKGVVPDEVDKVIDSSNMAWYLHTVSYTMISLSNFKEIGVGLFDFLVLAPYYVGGSHIYRDLEYGSLIFRYDNFSLTYGNYIPGFRDTGWEFQIYLFFLEGALWKGYVPSSTIVYEVNRKIKDYRDWIEVGSKLRWLLVGST